MTVASASGRQRHASLPVLALGACMAGAMALGAAVGAWFATRAPAHVERPAVERESVAAQPAEGNGALERAIADLSAEVGALRRQLEAASARREVAPTGSSPETTIEPDPIGPTHAAAWVTALERAAAALTMAANRASAAAGEVRVPRQPMRVDRILGLMQQDPVEANLDHVFWTVQQVLDVYGRPTQMNSTFMEYVASDREFLVTFSLKEGRVHNVSW